jgi:C4-dicarboxylate transporter, DctQ subunit
MGTIKPIITALHGVSTMLLNLLHKADRILTVLEKATVAALLLAAVAVLVADVALRSIFGVALAWAAELTRYSIVWLVFVGGAIGARSGAHISIDALGIMMSPDYAQRLAQVASLIASATTLLVAWFGWKLVGQMKQFGQTSASLEVPMWAVYLAIPVGCMLMSLRFLQNAFSISTDAQRLSVAQSTA